MPLKSLLASWRSALPRFGHRESALVVREGEGHYARLIENMRDALMIDDVNGKVLWANNRFHELFGIPPEELHQISLADYVALEYRAELRERHENRMAGIDVPTLFEYEGLRKDGTRIWLEVQVTEVRHDGVILGTQSVIRDISERKRIDAVLLETESKFRQIVETTEEGVWTIDRDARTTFVNPKMASMLGYSAEEMLGKKLHDFAAPDWKTKADEGLDRRRRGIAEHHEFAFIRRDGSLLWASLATSPIQDGAGDYVGALAMVTDMTERKRMELELRESEERWKLALEATGAGVYDCDLETGVVSRALQWKQLLGFAASEIGTSEDEFYERIHPEDLDRVIEEAAGYLERDTPYQNQYRMLHREGTWRWILDRGMVISRDTAGKAVRIVGTLADITSQKQSEEITWRQANFDSLTGLANRYLFKDRLDRDLKNTRRGDDSLALLLIDLDDFKNINDSFGHDAGDTLLIEAARRLRASVRETDTVVRLGGDEFAVVLPALKTLPPLNRILQTLASQLNAPYRLGDADASISASIGVSLFPGDATDADQLLKHADRAMYAAKSSGRGEFEFYTPAHE